MFGAVDIGSVVNTFVEYFRAGGYVMPALVAATMALWFGLGYRMVTLVRGRGLGPRELVRRALAGELGTPRSPVERMAVLGAQVQGGTVEEVRRALEVIGEPIRTGLGAFRVLTRAVVAVAPLLGLLGTVSGMIETFASLGDMTLFSQSGGIAAGISQALLTTQFGLAIAIPGLILSGLLDRRQEVLESEIEEVQAILSKARSTGEAS